MLFPGPGPGPPRLGPGREDAMAAGRLRWAAILCIAVALASTGRAQLPAPPPPAPAEGIDPWAPVPVGPIAGLLPELDTSSPAATLRAFLSEARRIEALYADYRAAPITATERAMAHGMQRIGLQLFDLREVPPATRLKDGAAAAGFLA